MKKIIESKNNFIQTELWYLTFGGAFQRVNVYTKEATDDQRKEVRAFLIGAVKKLVDEQYSKGSVSPEKHIENIEALIELSREKKDLLFNDYLHFGVCQKLLNLHLKYLWVFGMMPEPPHFPVDRIIQEKVGFRPIISWSKEMDREGYERVVEHVRGKAKEKGMSLAEYELVEFGRR